MKFPHDAPQRKVLKTLEVWISGRQDGQSHRTRSRQPGRHNDAAHDAEPRETQGLDPASHPHARQEFHGQSSSGCTNRQDVSRSPTTWNCGVTDTTIRELPPRETSPAEGLCRIDLVPAVKSPDPRWKQGGKPDHPPEIFVAVSRSVLCYQFSRQCRDYLSPVGSTLFPEDIPMDSAADMPVQQDQFYIHRSQSSGSLPCRSGREHR
jgi:hypothetical protein